MPIDMPPVAAHEQVVGPPIRVGFDPATLTGRTASIRASYAKYLPNARAVINMTLYRRVSGALVGSALTTTSFTVTRTQNYAVATVSAPVCNGVRRGLGVRVWAVARASIYANGTQFLGTWNYTSSVATYRCA